MLSGDFAKGSNTYFEYFVAICFANLERRVNGHMALVSTKCQCGGYGLRTGPRNIGRSRFAMHTSPQREIHTKKEAEITRIACCQMTSSISLENDVVTIFV